MGYTHYWYRKLGKIDKKTFIKIVSDFSSIIPKLKDFGIELADGNGEGTAMITDELVCFNGPTECGHAKNEEISIPWPAKDAVGVLKGFDGNEPSGHWFAGAEIDKRMCNGDCSYESFVFPIEAELRDYEKREGKKIAFDFCKTAFRPYDLAVNCFLIIAKHHLKDDIKVYSDGDSIHWAGGRIICHQALGYGLEFELDRES